MRERPLTRGFARVSHLQNDAQAHDPVITLTKDMRARGLRKKGRPQLWRYTYSCSRKKHPGEKRGESSTINYPNFS